MNICLLGLRGSGKTCYLYSSSYVLSKGVYVNGTRLSVECSDIRQKNRLNERFLAMLRDKSWPSGTDRTDEYPFEFKIDGKSFMNFKVHDFRGGILNVETDEEQGLANDLFDTIADTSCLIFLVNGETILSAMDPKTLSHGHRRSLSEPEKIKAEMDINHIEHLLRECNKRMKRNVPILLVITKSDLFTSQELINAEQFLRMNLPTIFSKRNDVVVAITAVSLGENLANDNSRFSGTLYPDLRGNIHIPLLFALMQKFDEPGIPNIDEFNAKKMIHRIFSDDKIKIFRGGVPAFIV